MPPPQNCAGCKNLHRCNLQVLITFSFSSCINRCTTISSGHSYPRSPPNLPLKVKIQLQKLWVMIIFISWRQYWKPAGNFSNLHWIMWTCHSVKILGQRGLNFCHLASRIAHKFCLDALARICLAGLIAGNRQQWRQAWRKALMITTVTFAYFLLIFSCMMSLPPCSISPCSNISTSKSSSTGTYLRLEPRFINFHTICPFASMFKTMRDLVRLISSKVDFSPTLFSATSLATLVCSCQKWAIFGCSTLHLRNFPVERGPVPLHHLQVGQVAQICWCFILIALMEGWL